MGRKGQPGDLNNTSAKTENQNNSSSHKLGMFPGVFTPSILTILGIILFLRMGYTVGNAGLCKALLLVTIASLVSILTTASLSAIATNIHVKGGGAYYLISRTLGVQFGGAIGLVLFLAQSVSIAFYCIGFGESLANLIPPQSYLSPQIIAMISVIFLFFLAWLGADWATKFQYIVMGLLILALCSFFLGGIMKFDSELVVQNYTAPDRGLPFWVLFAIFFPAVTGFTQGVNMSGDLKDPGKAIPFGTFLAVGLSTLIYYLAAIIFAGAMANTQLLADYGAMKKVSIIPGLIDAGVIAATLSSAMASFLGSPRILQSIAKDRIFNILNPFSKGVGITDNPRRGVLLSGAIAIITISLGQLNLIAQVVSMFFLISYGLINYATYFESRTASPSFRPRFRWFSPWLSLAGFFICAGAILAIDIRSGIMALCILVAIYQYLKHTSGPARWADSRRSNYLKQAKENLNAAAVEPEHDRDWRPVILALTNDSKRLKSLLEFSKWLEGKAGITVAVRLIKGQGLKIKSQREKVFKELSTHINDLNSQAYPLVISVPDIPKSLPVITQSFGLGPLKANTILINWMDEMNRGLAAAGPANYANNLRIVFREGLNLVILHADENRWQKVLNRSPKEQQIDVWWENNATSKLMLLLAYLMTRRNVWSKARIRILAFESDEKKENTNDDLQRLMEDVRIDAEPVIVPDHTVETIIKMSSTASFVFLPCRIRDSQVLDAQGGQLPKILPYLPMTALVMAAQDIDLEAEPDTGIPGELAEAEDEFLKAKRKYEAAQKQALKLQEKTEILAAKLEEYPKESESFPKALKEADQAIEAEEGASRKATKAKVKAKEAAKTFEQVSKGISPEDDKKDL
ncbi:MAG: amino acid permease [Desulfobacteraceae bacterium]|nr:amino acid permease [Desulfobacteraceae bacterium]